MTEIVLWAALAAYVLTGVNLVLAERRWRAMRREQESRECET